MHMDDNDSGTGPAHHPGARKGEEMSEGQDNPGREDTESTHADRPAGKSHPRAATGINPEDEMPIDPASPVWPPD
jgi:hypothetical protein